MARFLGGATILATRPADPSLDPSTGAAVDPASGRPITAARRGSRPAWRDPRLWVGVVLVAASVVGGARVLAAADDTVQVWAAATDLGAGRSLGPDDLIAERVHFGDARQRAAYFGTDQTLPADLQLTRSVGAGELLARSAVGSATASGLLEVPIAVDPEQVPPSVSDGAVVDVYVVAPPAAGAGGQPEAAVRPAIAQATVVDAPAPTSSFGATGKRQLVLAVKDAEAQAFFALLSRYDAPVLTVVRHG